MLTPAISAFLPSQPIRVDDLIGADKPVEELFTHLDDEPPYTQRTFAVSRLNHFCERANVEKFLVPITKDMAEFCVNNRGVEPHRVQRLRPEDLAKPLLFIEWPSTIRSHLLIDGTHRLVRLVQEGQTEALAYIVSDPAIWEKFLVHGVPHQNPVELLARKSGI